MQKYHLKRKTTSKRFFLAALFKTLNFYFVDMTHLVHTRNAVLLLRLFKNLEIVLKQPIWSTLTMATHMFLCKFVC